MESYFHGRKIAVKVIALVSLMSVTGAVLGADQPRKYALLIAVTEHDEEQLNSPERLFPETDAKDLGELLHFAGYEVDLLLGVNATQSAVRKKLSELSRQTGRDGIVVLGLFGRGFDVELYDGRNRIACESYFCPADAMIRTAKDAEGRIILGDKGGPLIEPDPKSLLTLAEILSALQAAKAEKRVVFTDCSCVIPNKLGHQAFGASVQATDLPTQTAVFFSCGPNEQPLEQDEWRNSALMKCLLQEVQELNASGMVTTGALGNRVRKKVSQLSIAVSTSKRQSPRLVGGNSIDLQFPKPTSLLVGRRAGEPKELVPGIAFHWCPLGNGTMGSPPRENDRHKNEDQVEVSLSGFWLAETELTQRQWRMLMRTTPWSDKANLHAGRLVISMAVKEGDDFPATYVSHGDPGTGTIEPNSATDFCRRLTEREQKLGRLPPGWKYSLPTEAQWEYACRAGTTTRFNFGDDAKQLGDYGWWGAKYGDGSSLGNAWKEPYANRVRLKLPNAWGFYDIHGNVWEWCADWFTDKLPGGRDPQGAAKGSIRVCRGGCWLLDAPSCRSALRSGGSPENRNSVLGFRLACTSSKD